MNEIKDHWYECECGQRFHCRQTWWVHKKQCGQIPFTYSYRDLEEGEIIQEGDEVDMSTGLNEDARWVKTTCVGEKVPDPQFISHRKYRRML